MHSLYGPLIGTLWGVWLLYWYAASRDVKQARRQESPRSRAAHLVPLIIACLLLAFPEYGDGWFFATIMPRSKTVYWIGVAILIAGFWVAVQARRTLGRNWSAVITVKQNHELIRSGPYRWLRHPIYTGLLLGLLGTAVSLSEWRGVAAVVMATYALSRKIRLEENWMTETFGDSYRQYRTEVRALIPFIL